MVDYVCGDAYERPLMDVGPWVESTIRVFHRLTDDSPVCLPFTFANLTPRTKACFALSYPSMNVKE
jgi:hypothetical protein